jgi:hypothetical protein
MMRAGDRNRASDLVRIASRASSSFGGVSAAYLLSRLFALRTVAVARRRLYKGGRNATSLELAGDPRPRESQERIQCKGPQRHRTLLMPPQGFQAQLLLIKIKLARNFLSSVYLVAALIC